MGKDMSQQTVASTTHALKSLPSSGVSQAKLLRMADAGVEIVDCIRGGIARQRFYRMGALPIVQHDNVTDFAFGSLTAAASEIDGQIVVVEVYAPAGPLCLFDPTLCLGTAGGRFRVSAALDVHGTLSIGVNRGDVYLVSRERPKELDRGRRRRGFRASGGLALPRSPRFVGCWFLHDATAFEHSHCSISVRRQNRSRPR